MSLLLSTKSVSKTYGAVPLFEDVTLAIREGDRLGIIGPNGSGKSTLLEILAGQREPDTGEVVRRKGVGLAYVMQDSRFPAGATVRQVIRQALAGAGIPEYEQSARESETLGRAGFEDFDAEASALSGGWRKRLAIAEALVRDPAILLLDEPTNHLDLAGIAWLEALLRNARFASVTISHDRYFLENVPTSVAELDRIYPEDLFLVAGNYSTFLERKAEYLQVQAQRQESLENRVRTEIEWLRRGPKARATKSKSRINQANQMIGELAESKSRARVDTANIDFAATGRKTKRLMQLEGVTYGYDGQPLISDLDFTFTSGTRVGLVGANGSGKTTLLRLLRGEIEPQAGEITRAEGLRIVYFNQIRQLDPELTLRRALAPDSDSVVYRDQVIHVASWAARFLFDKEQLNQPVGRLSGGERARVLIASMMLDPADVLLLDEPTNDLDIPTLEILEESLLEFPGAMVLVTHDRYLLDRVSTVVLGLAGKGVGQGEGKGQAERFADYSQWEAWQSESQRDRAREASAGEEKGPVSTQGKPSSKKKLSYLELREYEGIEDQIAAADQVLAAKRAVLEDPEQAAELAKDGRRMEQAYREIEQAQEILDRLYERWADLETKAG